MMKLRKDAIKKKISFIRLYLNYFLREYRIQLLQCIPAVVIFLLATYRLSDIGQPILFNDEIGYWSNSAFFMGMDWTSVTGRISYYSYGYSLLLVPIRMFGAWLDWGYITLYRAAVVMNAVFLVMSYVLSLKLTKRYLSDLNTSVRTAACFSVFTYSSYIVYAHITWTECTLVFFFWVFLYVMMRVVDQPGVGNHIAFALVSFCLYTVHQRSLGIVMTAMLMVVYIRLLKRNSLRDVAAFFGTIYLYSLIHAMIKGNLQSVNYLGGEPAGLSTILGYALTKKAVLLLGAGIVMLCLLWLLDRAWRKTLFGLVMAGIVCAVGYAILQENGYLSGGLGILSEGGTAGNRLSTNELAGQWNVLKNLFSRNGLIRLGISMTGKWFYLAATSGFVICWGIWGLFKNAFILLGENIRQLLSAGRAEKHHRSGGNHGKDESSVVTVGTAVEIPGSTVISTENVIFDDNLIMNEAVKYDISDRSAVANVFWNRVWLLGVLLAWFSTFMISAIYKEGLFKNDDLFNGRYIEFTIGFVLLYSLNCLINDRKWLFSFIICMILYRSAGHLCQYTIDEVQRKEFELAHCVMFGRVFWNYEVPYGKVDVLWEYIRPLSIWFCVILMLARRKLSRIATMRTIMALMVPVMVWSHLGKTIVDVYVVVRNEKQAEPYPQFSTWIRVLGKDEKVYFVLDWANERYAGSLQYMLQDQPVTVTSLEETSFTENAFYVIKSNLWETDKIANNCEVIVHSGGYLLLTNKK